MNQPGRSNQPYLPGPRRTLTFPEDLSDEELARDWTLSSGLIEQLQSFRTRYRLANAVQLRALQLSGRFLKDPGLVPPRIIAFLASQLEVTVPLTLQTPTRLPTLNEQQNKLLKMAGFRRFDREARIELEVWLDRQAQSGLLPNLLLERAEQRLLRTRTALPGVTTLERLVAGAFANGQKEVFRSIYDQLPEELREGLNGVLVAPEGEQRSFFYQLKEYPPQPTIRSMKLYLERYRTLQELFREGLGTPDIDPVLSAYLFQVARSYSAKDIKRFREEKRLALMVCFLHESRKVVLDHLVEMHDKFILNMCRDARSAHEAEFRAIRKRQRRALDSIIQATTAVLDWPADTPWNRENLWTRLDQERLDEGRLRDSIRSLRDFQRLERQGYGERLVARYPNLRKYFAQFIRLPIAAEKGSEDLVEAIQIVRRLDAGELRSFPQNTPTRFVPIELRRVLRDGASGALHRNAWETGLALAIRDAFRSGDLYLQESKQHVSFWELLLTDSRWKVARPESYAELQKPEPDSALTSLVDDFEGNLQEATVRFSEDSFAQIHGAKLKLRRDDFKKPPKNRLQKTINAGLPLIRIEKLLAEVDQATGFTRSFVPLQGHGSRPTQFYKSLLAAIISQATNLGIVSMSASVGGVTVDMLRHVLQYYVRDETLRAANASIVDAHHGLPLSAIHGDGRFSSSDAQRFKIRADSLLGSYYPRYFGYYEKAISLYTHVSDQYSVFATRAISCGPREALYVLDGLLENDTVLRIRDHTTDTDGYTEIVFALCHLLGYDFMPRIKDLKAQQLYRPTRTQSAGVFAPLLSKKVDMGLIEEQWDPMMRLAWSLKVRTAPANIIVQRLTNGSPHDRLSKAVRHLGRLAKTNYILRYMTDPKLRRSVQRQLNKGEYRQKLSRWVFFGQQGEFTTGDYVEIMNKASCLSLVSNAILFWNTTKIGEIVDRLRADGKEIDEEELSHVSLLPFRHVLPNGTYFIEDQ